MLELNFGRISNMNKFTRLNSTCLLIKSENVDTDQIIPAQFLKTTKKNGLGKYLFYNWRNNKDKKKKNSIFNYSQQTLVQILIAGNNFGCGSSREHAVWALQDFGFKVIISSSFGDIFYNNALKNGLLPVIIKSDELEILLKIIERNHDTKIRINLDRQKVYVAQKKCFIFSIDPFRKMCLLKGIDELSYIFAHKEKIKKFENHHKLFIFINSEPNNNMLELNSVGF